MNIKTKLTLNIGVLVAMIVLLVSLSVVNLQILTGRRETSDDSSGLCFFSDSGERTAGAG